MPIRVLVYGLGPIGSAVSRQLVARKGFSLVGAVDTDRNKVGLDVGQVIGIDKKLRIRVTNDAVGGITQSAPDVVVMCTTSSLKKALPAIQTVLKLKTPLVSTTEELSYPVGRNRALARQIDVMAKKAKVAVLGTGRQSRLRDGRPAGDAERGVRAHRPRARGPRAGRPHPPPAVPAEDRRRIDHRAVRREGEGWLGAPRRPGRIDHDDRDGAQLAARRDHRRDHAEGGDHCR